MEMKKRYERKYLVHNDYLEVLRKRVQIFCEADEYAIRDDLEYPQYTVKSIYFDSIDWNAYDEKLEGLRDRNKLRIRGYNHYQPDNKVFFEIKHKFENRIGKSRALIPFHRAAELLENGNIEDFHPHDSRSGQDLNRFLYFYHRYNQRPVTTVVYEREPYFGRFDSGVRITFDKNIRANLFPELDELYNDANCEPCWPNHFILEIKYFTDEMPRWARSFVQEFEIRHEALSKYAQGIDVNLKTNPIFGKKKILTD